MPVICVSGLDKGAGWREREPIDAGAKVRRHIVENQLICPAGRPGAAS